MDCSRSDCATNFPRRISSSARCFRGLAGLSARRKLSKSHCGCVRVSFSRTVIFRAFMPASVAPIWPAVTGTRPLVSWKCARPSRWRTSKTDDNDEVRITNDEERPNARVTKERSDASFRHLDFVIPSSLDICHSSFLHTRTPGSLSEMISDSERTHRFQEGNLPGGL